MLGAEISVPAGGLLVARGALAFGEAGPAGAAVEEPILAVLAEPAGDGEISGAASSGIGASGILATEARKIVHGASAGLEGQTRKRLGTLLGFQAPLYVFQLAQAMRG